MIKKIESIPFKVEQLGNSKSSIYIPLQDGERRAECTQCNRVSKSQVDLPHFRAKSDLDHDEYYCGCKGWD